MYQNGDNPPATVVINERWKGVKLGKLYVIIQIAVYPWRGLRNFMFLLEILKMEKRCRPPSWKKSKDITVKIATSWLKSPCTYEGWRTKLVTVATVVGDVRRMDPNPTVKPSGVVALLWKIVINNLVWVDKKYFARIINWHFNSQLNVNFHCSTVMDMFYRGIFIYIIMFVCTHNIIYVQFSLDHRKF